MSNNIFYLGHRLSGVNSINGRGRQIVHSSHEQQHILSGSPIEWCEFYIGRGRQIVHSSHEQQHILSGSPIEWCEFYERTRKTNCTQFS